MKRSLFTSGITTGFVPFRDKLIKPMIARRNQNAQVEYSNGRSLLTTKSALSEQYSGCRQLGNPLTLVLASATGLLMHKPFSINFEAS